ncbi:hypothetical protein C8R45DRAFT_1076574 [Mycena sanguinolenta]|nr:hypothetical protein C8R45DRAFT_1076574 [Mycena sanguinolenta]
MRISTYRSRTSIMGIRRGRCVFSFYRALLLLSFLLTLPPFPLPPHSTPIQQNVDLMTPHNNPSPQTRARCCTARFSHVSPRVSCARQTDPSVFDDADEGRVRESAARRDGGSAAQSNPSARRVLRVRVSRRALRSLAANVLELLVALARYRVMRVAPVLLNDAVARLFFSVLVLKINRNGLSEETIQKPEALATGATGLLHAKTLHILPWIATTAKHDEKLVDILAAGLTSLTKIRTVKIRLGCEPRDDFWTWGRTVFLDFLNKLATLEELELYIPPTLDVSGLQVRSLRKLTLKLNPRLPIATMPAALPQTQGYQTITDLILAQNRLSALHLEDYDRESSSPSPSSEWSAGWRLLHSTRHNMKLTEITTNVITRELFGYLASFSGLQKVTLGSPDGGNLDASNRLADAFFETVLPRHAYESRFSFGTHNVHVLLLLRNLTNLEMSVNGGAVRRNRAGSTTHVDENGTTHITYPQVGSSARGIPAEADQADVTPVVTLLLQTAASLPALRKLTISAAETEYQRGWWGVTKLDHRGAINAALMNAVEGFRTDVPCVAVAYYIPHSRVNESLQSNQSIEQGQVILASIYKGNHRINRPNHRLEISAEEVEGAVRAISGGAAAINFNHLFFICRARQTNGNG